MNNILAFVFLSIANLLVNSKHKLNNFNGNQNKYSLGIECPSCGSHYIIKNGSIHNRKQKYEYKDCRRQFVEYPKNIVISLETKQLVDKLMLERISLKGISRVTGVSWDWLQNYVNHKLAHTPR